MLPFQWFADICEINRGGVFRGDGTLQVGRNDVLYVYVSRCHGFLGRKLSYSLPSL